MLAGNPKLDEDLIGDGDCCEDELLNVFCQVADLVDEFVGNVIFILQVEEGQLRIHHLQQIVLIDHRVRQFLKSTTFYLQVSHEFAFIWWVIVNLPDLPHFSLVMPVSV